MEWNTYFGDKLSSSAHEYYIKLRNQFESGSYLKEQLFILPVGSRSSDDAFQEAHDALWALFYDEPLFFNHNSTDIHYAPCPSSGEIIVDPGAIYSRAQCEHIKELLIEELELLTSGCGNLSEYEKARLVYERVRTRYSYSAGIVTSDGEKLYEPDDYTAAGAVLRRSCVCSGYAAILMIAFRKIGLPCIRVRGASHAWVMVKINGIAVHCDVTNEPLTPNGDVPFTYFSLCENDILKSIQVIESDVPRSMFSRYSYHEHYHCFFSTALEAANYISAQFRKGESVVRVRLAEDGGKISTAISMGIRNDPTSKYSWIKFDNLNSAIITKN